MLDIKLTFKVTHNGTDITSHVISYTRQASICEGEEKLSLIVDNGNFNTFDEIDVYENGSRVKKYYINTVSRAISPDTYTIEASDIKKVRDYFIPENYTVDFPSTPKYWIEKFAADAGVSVIFTASDDGGYLSNNTSLGMTSFYDQMQTLLQIAGWYMRTDSDGNLVIGDLKVQHTPSIEITEYTKFQRRRFDKSLRNRAVVWGSANPERGEWVFADVRTSTPWNLVDRTVVVANSNIPDMYTAYDIANKVIKEFNKLDDIIEITVPAVSGLNLGNSAYINIDNYRGIVMLTSYRKSVNANGGATETLVFNERCPRLFAYWGWDTDWIYVATDKGIYRKMMITYSGQNNLWYDFNSGIPLDDRITTKVSVHNGLLGTVTSGGNAYYRDIINTYWRKISVSGNVVSVGVDGDNVLIGQNIENEYSVDKVTYFGDVSNITSASGIIYDLDSNDFTGYMVIQGGSSANQNFTVSNYVWGECEGCTYIYSQLKFPSSHQINIVDSYNNNLSYIDIDTGADYILHGKSTDFAFVYNNNTYSYDLYKWDRESSSIELVSSLPEDVGAWQDMPWAVLSADEERIYAFAYVDDVTQKIYCISTSSGAILFTVYLEIDSGYYFYDFAIVASGNMISVFYIMVDDSNDSMICKETIINDVTRTWYTNTVYTRQDAVTYNIYMLSEEVPGDEFVSVFVRIEDTSNNYYLLVYMNDHYNYTMIEKDVSTINNYFTTGTCKECNKIFLSNANCKGFYIDINTKTISEAQQFYSNPRGLVTFIEDGDKLYLANLDSYRLQYEIIDMSTMSEINYVNQTDKYIVGIDKGRFIYFYPDSSEIYCYTQEGGFICKLEFPDGIYHDETLANIEVGFIGGLIHYADDSTYLHIRVPHSNYILTEGEAEEFYTVHKDSYTANKVLTIAGKYNVSIGKTAAYLYSETPIPTYLGMVYKDTVTFINNGMNMVTFPRESEIVPDSSLTTISGNNRKVFAVSTNNITETSISGIINSEYYILPEDYIPIPISGSIMEVSNYVLDNKEVYPKMVISNGVDKIYENIPGTTDFCDVTENLLDDFEVTEIYWIAIDDDL